MGGTRKGVEREKPTGPSTSQHGSGMAHGNGTIGAGAHRHIGASPHRGHRAPPCGTPRPMAICRPRILRPAAIGAGAHRCICTVVTVHRRAARHGRWQYAAADGKMAIVARWWQRGGSSTAAARRRHSSGGSASSVLRTRTTVICSNGHMQWSTSPWLGEGTGREAHQACGEARGARAAAQHKPTAHWNAHGAARHACVSNYGRAAIDRSAGGGRHTWGHHTRGRRTWGAAAGPPCAVGCPCPCFLPPPRPSYTLPVPAAWHRRRRALQRRLLQHCYSREMLLLQIG
eukprot:COSAG01_NODE_7587_length_3137_cov_7.399605_4_plen_287_part_00